MQRIEAIRNIMNTVDDSSIVISSCGKISREVFYVKDRPKNFYVQGSMGSSLAIGIGISLCKPEKVVVIAGDGEILMSLGTLVLLNKLQKEKKVNIDLYILDNNKFQSTGGQKTCSDAVEFRLLCDCKVIFCSDSEVEVPRISIPHKEIKERFMNAI